MALGTLVAATLVTLPAVVQAALPKKGAFYKGTATGGAAAPDMGKGKSQVRLKVSTTGRRVSFRTPQGCPTTFNPLPKFYGRINNLKVSAAGSFKGKRTYQSPSGNARFDTIHWKINVKGRFVTSRKARGTVTYEMATSGPGYQSCGQKSGHWSATICPSCKALYIYGEKGGIISP